MLPMKIFPRVIFFFLLVAPPPPRVKVASKLLGRNVLHKAKDEVFNPDKDQDNDR